MDKLFTTFAAGQCNAQTFLGLKPWYFYIPMNSQCGFDPTGQYQFHLLGANSDLLLIFLAIVDDLLIIAGIVAVFFVIYAGIRYITSQGSPDETAKAQSTLTFALIGLAIAVVAVPIISYLGNRFGTGGGGSVPIAGGNLDLNTLPNPAGVTTGSIIQKVLQDLFGVIGGLSLIFIIIGGLRYIYSGGEPQNTATAKSTIIYAIIGLCVAIVAESIVALVLGKL